MAMGVRQTGIPLGGASAAAILPALATQTGWRVAIASGGTACLVAAVVCGLVLHHSKYAGCHPEPKQGEGEECSVAQPGDRFFVVPLRRMTSP